MTSERSSARLFALDGLEQCLEISFTERTRSVALDDLEEQRGPVLDGLGKDLQEIALLVAVDEDVQLRQFVQVFRNVAHTTRQRIVVRAGNVDEGDVVVPQRL